MRAADALFGNRQLVACGCPLYRVTFDALLCLLGVWCVSADGRLHRLSQMNSNGFFCSFIFQINSEIRKMWPSNDRKWFIWYGKHGTTFQILTLFSYASSSQSFQPEHVLLASIIWFGFNLVPNCSWLHFFLTRHPLSMRSYYANLHWNSTNGVVCTSNTWITNA